MALYPAAQKRLLPDTLNHSKGGMGTIQGVVVHVIVGSLAAADSVFHRPGFDASAHFGVGKDGTVYQWVDTADKAWAEAAGNSHWISVETEGRPEEPLTQRQIEEVAKIVRWAADQHHFAVQVTDSTAGQGVGTHSMGGGAWGGHACPGAIRAGQRPAIVALAKGQAPPAPAPPAPPAPHPAPAPAPAPGGTVSVNVPVLREGARGGAVKTVQGLLNVKAGQGLNVDGVFGPATTRAVRNWQTILRLGVDGVVGANTWSTLVNV